MARRNIGMARIWRRIVARARRDADCAACGVGDREAAAALKGADIGVPSAALPATEENEIYYADLVGLAVMNRQGVRLGTVSKVQDFGAHPVLCVTDEAAAAERMIPFVAAYVDGVDVAAGRIDVDWQPDY